MAKIRRIAIQNFRSIHRLEMDASDLTVIVGDNDSGKSNVLRALNLFFNGHTNPNTPFNFLNDYNRYAEAGQKRAKEIVVELHLEVPDSYKGNNGDLVGWRKRWRADGLYGADDYWGIKFERKKRGQGFIETPVKLSNRSRVPSLLRRIQFEYVPAVRSADFFRELRGRIFEVIAQASEGTVRASSGQFETVIGDAVSDLLADISRELNDESKLRLPNDLTTIFESLDFLNGEKSISLDNRGDGIKARYIPLILKFIAEKSRELKGLSPTFIWAYEEPENNLEFRRAQALADAFKKLAQDEFSQVFLTTHSPVFYNMHLHEDSGELCTAYHLSHGGVATGTKARSAKEATTSLDETMGAMAIIAPHIRAAQDALAEATIQTEDLKAKLHQHNGENKPTLFVEGATEYIVFRTLLEKFRSEKAKHIYLAEPPRRAGANYVTNMLRSWEYRTKHLLPEKRTRAIGIVDADKEGKNAAARFVEENSAWKHATVLCLPTPEHLSAAGELGLDIPICFEELWPKEQWQTALANEWLIDRPRSGLIGEKLISRLANEDARLSDMIGADWRIYFEKCVNGIHGSNAKSLWATYVSNLPDADLESIATEHLRLLDEALTALSA